MEHNIDRLISFGIKDFWFSVNYLKEQIKEYFDESKKEIKIRYIEEGPTYGDHWGIIKGRSFSK